MNPLELRDQQDPSETSRNRWIRLFQFVNKLKLHTILAPETVN